MIEKLKRTPKAKHGWRVWLRTDNLPQELECLSMFLQCEEIFYNIEQHQYGKPTFMFYTDCDEYAVWVDKLI